MESRQEMARPTSSLCPQELVLTLRELPGHAEGEAFRIPLRLQSYHGVGAIRNGPRGSKTSSFEWHMAPK